MVVVLWATLLGEVIAPLEEVKAIIGVGRGSEKGPWVLDLRWRERKACSMAGIVCGTLSPLGEQT